MSLPNIVPAGPTPAVLGRLARDRRLPEAAAGLATAAVLVLALTVVPTRLGVGIALPALGLIAVAVTLLTPRVEWTLLGLVLYLGCLDGPLKLVSGSSAAPLFRDVLLVAVVAGVVLRHVVDGRRLPRIPYAGLVVAFVIVVVAQAANPTTPGLAGAIAGWRQQLEFVPLIFVAVLVADRDRIYKEVGLVLLALTVPNVIAAIVQSNLTLDQFASWGPGYRERVLGLGEFSGAPRAVRTDSGLAVRPFGLGSDAGAAGIFGWMAVAFALAFALASRRISGRLWLGGGGFLLCGLSILTSQSRGVVLAAIVSCIVFFVLWVKGRNAVSAVVALGVTVLVTYAFVAAFVANSDDATVERLSTVAPGSAAATIGKDRGSSIALIPEYIEDYPLGVGLGRSGPNASLAGSPSGLNAENEFNFLIGEIGAIGLLAFAALWLVVLRDAVRLARRAEDDRERAFWCAIAATLVATTLVWFQASPSIQPPTAPFFWFVAGVVGVRTAAAARGRGG